MGDIQSEENYPPKYLHNVSEKVKQIRDQINTVESKAPELTKCISYKVKKVQLYKNLNDLSHVLDEYETIIQNKETGATTQDTMEQIKSITENLAQHDESVSALKKLANETLLHSGAANDPGNSIKADLYAFCARWNGLQSKLSESRVLRKVPTIRHTSEIKLREASKMEADIKLMKKNGLSENQITNAQTLLGMASNTNLLE